MSGDNDLYPILIVSNENLQILTPTQTTGIDFNVKASKVDKSLRNNLATNRTRNLDTNLARVIDRQGANPATTKTLSKPRRDGIAQPMQSNRVGIPPQLLEEAVFIP